MREFLIAMLGHAATLSVASPVPMGGPFSPLLSMMGSVDVTDSDTGPAPDPMEDAWKSGDRRELGSTTGPVVLIEDLGRLNHALLRRH